MARERKLVGQPPDQSGSGPRYLTGGAVPRSSAARGIGRGGVASTGCAVSRRGRDLAFGAEIGQVDAEPMDPGRQLAIDDLRISAGQSCRKSISGLRGRLTDSGFGNSAALGRAAADDSDAGHKDDAKGCQRGCCQVKETTAPRRLGSGSFLASSDIAHRRRFNRAHRHYEASFWLPTGIAG
jgi:hypothetical protein